MQAMQFVEILMDIRERQQAHERSSSERVRACGKRVQKSPNANRRMGYKVGGNKLYEIVSCGVFWQAEIFLHIRMYQSKNHAKTRVPIPK